MANYTIELRELLDNGFKPALDEYPIFDEEHRAELNKKIIEHYYFREIGQETPERFNYMLRRTMNEIMPHYNNLYKSAAIEFDPLFTDLVTETEKLDGLQVNNDKKKEDSTGTSETKDNTDTTNSTTTSSNDEHNNTIGDVGHNRKWFSDTPQTNSNWQPSVKDSLYYATTEDATTYGDTKTDEGNSSSSGKANSTGNTKGTSNTSTANKYITDNEGRLKTDNNITRIIKGYRGYIPSELILKYRETFINIDLLIIEDLASLFLNLY